MSSKTITYLLKVCDRQVLAPASKIFASFLNFHYDWYLLKLRQHFDSLPCPELCPFHAILSECVCYASQHGLHVFIWISPLGLFKVKNNSKFQIFQTYCIFTKKCHKPQYILLKIIKPFPQVTLELPPLTLLMSFIPATVQDGPKKKLITVKR